METDTETPITVIGFIAPERPDPSSTAHFANSGRAEQYAMDIMAEYYYVRVYQDGEVLFTGSFERTNLSN